MSSTTKRGRPAIGGTSHRYTVTDDVHAYIMRHGGGRWLNSIVAVLAANEHINTINNTRQ